MIQSVEQSLRVLSVAFMIFVSVVILSACSLEPKPTKSDFIQALFEEIKLIGSSLSSEKPSEATIHLERTDRLFSQLYKSKEDKKDSKSRACNIMMQGDLRDIQRLYRYALSEKEFGGERHAIGTIRGISVSKYGDCALTKEIFDESLVAKSLLLQHLDSVYPNDTETFEQRYYRIVDIQRTRETEAFTAWYSMDDADKKKFESNASVRACLDAATEDGALGITLSDLQSACRQGLR